MQINNQNINVEDYKNIYKSSEPFDHVIIDNFLNEDIANDITDYLESVDLSDWYFNPSQEQVNKWWMPELNKLDFAVVLALSWFNSKQGLEFFQELTKIDNLIPDPEFLGGGVHISTNGGSLDVHADFNFHPNLNVHRRLNALLFLNRDWDPVWGGQLQLWDTDLTEAKVKIEPIFNRLVIFNVSDEHFHGFPDPIQCPEHRRRISLALYYYTEDRPEEEKNPFHWVLWKNTKK
jgi:Rps23 Pro-64 3,4-dihydroxylase Tpa1-like proline 4-hydroxylase